MALVEKVALPGSQALARGGEQAAMKQLGRLNEENRRKARTFAKQQNAAERIAATTAQLASGVAEASSATEDLRRAMEQIAAGAEEAARASEPSQRAVAVVPDAIDSARSEAEASRQKSEALQELIAGVGQHGKGFAVVADEVRTLAETFEKSAQEIQELIGPIQADGKVIAGACSIEEAEPLLDALRADPVAAACLAGCGWESRA